VIRHEYQIRAEELVGIAHQRLADAVGEERHAGGRRYRDHERHAEHPQLSGAPVA
jgi:hypothetical protein